MQQNPKYSAQRLAGHEHIPLYPKGFVAVRILQLILGVVTLGLTAFLLAVTIAYPGDELMIFTSIANLIVTIYYIVAWFGPKSIYNYWAVLSLDVFMLVFWLISFALLASDTAWLFTVINEYTEDCDYDTGYCYTVDDYDSAYTTYAACMAGTAGIGGLEFILYIVSLSIHGVAMHRHRNAGLHSAAIGSGFASVAPTSGPEKINMVPTVNPVYQPVPQGQNLGPDPNYTHQNTGYPPQTSPQPPWAAPAQQPYSPPQQPYAEPQQQPTPAPYYAAQATPSPIPTQHTGASYTHPAQQLSGTPMQHQGPYPPPQ